VGERFVADGSGSTLLEPSGECRWVNPYGAEGADYREPPMSRRFIECLLVVSENGSSFPDGHVPGGPSGEFF
jgi:hypothetical protein